MIDSRCTSFVTENFHVRRKLKVAIAETRYEDNARTMDEARDAGRKEGWDVFMYHSN
jgi:hypothetical protein